MDNPLDLTGKHVIVTGASQGIGRATASHISRLGSKISMISRNEEKLHETHNKLEGKGHKSYPFDLKNIIGIEDLIKRIVLEQGPLSGLVHCAGIAAMRPLPMTKIDFLHDMMSINFYSYVELARSASKKGNFTEGASFIGMSSIASLAGDKSKTAYCASKAAMDAATKCMAKELAPKKIRVNTVVAGFIRTELLDQYVDYTGAEVLEKNVLERQFMGLGEAKDVANAVAYLLSDAAKFITGTGLIVDGGYLT